jgi:hypothetical protein
MPGTVGARALLTAARARASACAAAAGGSPGAGRLRIKVPETAASQLLGSFPFKPAWLPLQRLRLPMQADHTIGCKASSWEHWRRLRERSLTRRAGRHADERLHAVALPAGLVPLHALHQGEHRALASFPAASGICRRVLG